MRSLNEKDDILKDLASRILNRRLFKEHVVTSREEILKHKEKILKCETYRVWSDVKGVKE